MNYAGKRYGCVYVATNTATGEQYVGQTIKSLQVRSSAHIRAAKNPKHKIQHAIAQYGAGAFVFSEVFIAFGKEALDCGEREFISLLRPVYNSTIGGAGSPGCAVSETHKRKMLEGVKKRWADPETRATWVAALKKAAQSEESKQRGRNVQKYNGGAVRWAGHVKKVKVKVDRALSTSATWKDPQIRERRLRGLYLANQCPELRAKRTANMRGRRLPAETIKNIARQKWKPVFCAELQVSFLSQKHAAAFFGVCHSAIVQAVKNKGRVGGGHSLVRVA